MKQVEFYSENIRVLSLLSYWDWFS